MSIRNRSRNICFFFDCGYTGIPMKWCELTRRSFGLKHGVSSHGFVALIFAYAHALQTRKGAFQITARKKNFKGFRLKMFYSYFKGDSPLSCTSMHFPMPQNRLLTSVKNFRLQYPQTKDFGARSTWVFISITIIVSVIIMMLAIAGQAYEPITVYSRSYNNSGLLWYERLLRNATSRLGFSNSWSCSDSIVDLGDGSPIVCSELTRRHCDDEWLPRIPAHLLPRQSVISP